MHSCPLLGPTPAPYAPTPTPFPLPPQVRDRATLYLYQLQEAPEGPGSVNPHWRIPAKGLEAALQGYLAGETDEPFDLVGGVGRSAALCALGVLGRVCCPPALRRSVVFLRRQGSLHSCRSHCRRELLPDTHQA